MLLLLRDKLHRYIKVQTQVLRALGVLAEFLVVRKDCRRPNIPPFPHTREQTPGKIASIVDSVLAELRPKIGEEISRKLGEKK